jgi:hypothetical protein
MSTSNNNIPPKTKTKTKPNQTKPNRNNNKQRKTTFLQDELVFQRMMTTQAAAVSATNSFPRSRHQKQKRMKLAVAMSEQTSVQKDSANGRL